MNTNAADRATATLPGTTHAGGDTPAIEVNGLTRHFGLGEKTVKAVEGIDLRIERGEIVAFLGPNGAGKTTTIDMLLGLTSPSSGTVTVLGGTPGQAVTAGRISAVLQTGGLLHDLTVGETVKSIASLHGATTRVQEVMDRTELTALAKRKVSKCSGGEQQRLKFALALLPDPDVLILDEPTAGMDVTARRHFWNVMRADADAGRTIVFATHYLEEAEQFARRTVLVAKGRVVADAPTAHLRGSLTGRSISATVPAGTVERAVELLTNQAGVRDVEADGLRVRLTATDSDSAALLLLTQQGGTDLEIVAPTLETAFMALTEEER